MWDATSGQQLLKATHAATAETLTPGQWIYSVAISPDGTILAYAARGDGVAHVWNVETGRQILELKHDPPWPSSPSMAMAHNWARARTTARRASGNFLPAESWRAEPLAGAPKWSPSAPAVAGSPPAAWKDRSSSLKRDAPIGPHPSIFPQTVAVWRSARMAGASPWPRHRLAIYLW